MTKYIPQAPDHEFSQGDFRAEYENIEVLDWPINPDRTNGSKAATHYEPFRSDPARPVVDDRCNEYRRATENGPRSSSPEGRSQDFGRHFERLNEPQMMTDQLNPVLRFLQGEEWACKLTIVFGLVILFWANWPF